MGLHLGHGIEQVVVLPSASALKNYQRSSRKTNALLEFFPNIVKTKNICVAKKAQDVTQRLGNALI
jgi:hypothetical protein